MKKTTIGGLLHAVGTIVFGVGVVGQSVPADKMMTLLATAGFIVSACGAFYAFWFAADCADKVDEPVSKSG